MLVRPVAQIDRSLVDEIETSEQARLVLASVMDIARNLGMGVVVEGVETAKQRDVVFDLGARRAQGYFYGKPVPPVEALMAATSGARKANGLQAI